MAGLAGLGWLAGLVADVDMRVVSGQEMGR